MSKRTSLLIAGAVLVLGGAGLLLLHKPMTPSGPADTEIQSALTRSQDSAALERLAESLGKRPDALGFLQRTYAGTQDPATRERTLIIGAHLGSPDAARWIADVTATNKELAAQAGAALGSVSNPLAVPTLSKLALDDGPILVRANAIRALGNSGGPAQAVGMAELVVDAKQPLRIRQEAALAIAQLKNASVVPRLQAALAAAVSDTSSDGEQLRISIVQALGGIATPEAKKILEEHRSRNLSGNESLFTERALHPKG